MQANKNENYHSGPYVRKVGGELDDHSESYALYWIVLRQRHILLWILIRPKAG